MALTPAQIKQLAYNAGFRGSDLDTAVAVALAESGGNPTAYNPELASSYSRPGAGSRGLWQIFGAVHPNYNSDLAFDPATNARGAFEIYRAAGNKFTPWSAYTAGSYKKFLGSAASSNLSQNIAGVAMTAAQGIPGVSTLTATAAGLGSSGVTLTPQYTPGALLPSSISVGFPKIDWLSFGFVVAGGLLVILGLVILGLLFTKDSGPAIVGAAVKAAI